MKFAHFSHVWNKPAMTAAQRYRQRWRELALCDELGFDFGFTVEHHFNPLESWMTSPAAYCAAAAGHTRNMRLGPMGYVVPLYEPLRIIAEIARNLTSVDYLLDRNLVFVGSPETVSRRIKAAAAEGLFNTVFGEFNFGAISDDDLMQSIRLFATRVIPELRGFEPF